MISVLLVERNDTCLFKRDMHAIVAQETSRLLDVDEQYLAD